jgi:hypothetical protein
MSLPIIPFGADAYKIDFSVRLRAANSAYFTRTNVAAPTNEKVFTLSWWAKRGLIGTGSPQTMFGGTAGQASNISFGDLVPGSGADRLAMRDNDVGAYIVQSSGVLRDPTGWNHFVVRVNTTQATAANRVRLYVDGVEVAYTSSTWPALNYVLDWNAGGRTVSIGRRRGDDAQWYFDGLIAEPMLIDGQEFDPSPFARLDTSSGFWVPRRYTGTFGANGGWWKFADASAATAAALGKDSAPIDGVHTAANNWTPHNISVTAGPTFDQSRDTPTRNMPNWNPYTSNATLSAALLDAAGSNLGARATIPADTGKIYFEGYSASTGTNAGFGMATLAAVLDTNPFWESNSYGFKNTTGQLMNNGAYTAWAAAGTPATDIVQVAFDAATRKLWFGRNGTWLQAGDPVTGANPAFTLASGQLYFPTFEGDNPWSCSLNLGQRPFVYAPPSGFTAFGETPRAAPATSGTFTGNASASGPYVYLGGTPTTLTINGNAAIWGTHAIKLATGFRVITSSGSYNTAGSNSWSATGVVPFQLGRRRFNNAQVN